MKWNKNRHSFVSFGNKSWMQASLKLGLGFLKLLLVVRKSAHVTSHTKYFNVNIFVLFIL
jgi:hypothetical protein